MIGMTESHTKYHKRDKNVRYIDTVNKHLGDARLAVWGEKHEVPISSEIVELYAPKEFHSIHSSAYYYESISIYGLGNKVIIMLALTASI